jgi:hypothetical protein
MIDFLSDENGDIAVRGGDLATGEAQTVVVEQLVVASGGEFSQRTYNAVQTAECPYKRTKGKVYTKKAKITLKLIF